jgi:membrane protease YdiL (CAAX protease family)
MLFLRVVIVQRRPSASEVANIANLLDVPARRPWGIGATVVWGGIALLPPALGLLAYWRWFESTTAGEVVRTLAQLFTLVVVVAAARRAGWQAREYLGLSPPTMRDVSLGVGAKIALLLAAFVVVSAIGASSAMARIGTDALLERTAYLATLALFWASNVVVGPICEEVFWRGFVYRGLASSALGPAGAIMVISPIFALLHLDGLFAIVWHLLCGILYGCLRWRSGSLAAPVAAHALGNGIAAAYATF